MLFGGGGRVCTCRNGLRIHISSKPVSYLSEYNCSSLLDRQHSDVRIIRLRWFQEMKILTHKYIRSLESSCGRVMDSYSLPSLFLSLSLPISLSVALSVFYTRRSLP